jgi:hypothetical protein
MGSLDAILDDLPLIPYDLPRPSLLYILSYICIWNVQSQAFRRTFMRLGALVDSSGVKGKQASK